MAQPEHASLWTTNLPAAWPDPPAEMTVTTLSQIESCPRRWALTSAHYPAVWTGRGYPPRVQLSTLAGTVVHLALEAITKRLVKAGCPSVEDPAALQVMRNLGGYTKVVHDCIDQVLERLAESPRATGSLESAARSLRAQVPDLRTRAQTMMCRVRLPPGAIPSVQAHPSSARGPLTAGVFSEIGLRARRIGWKGKADLLTLSPAACEITDFKTGAPNEAHGFQIQVYALLWNRDTDLNPDRRRADRLVLGYSSGDVEVAAPTEAELDALELYLVARRDDAQGAVSQHPPEARPDPGHCRHCGVRQLCNEYWTGEIQGQMVEEAEGRRFADVEVTITGRHGPSSWDAVVECSSSAGRGQGILLRADNPMLAFRAGQRLRLLAVHMHIPDEQTPETEHLAIATMGAGSEAYIVTT